MTGPGMIEVPVDGPARVVFTTRAGGVSRGGFASLNLGRDRDDRDVRVNRGRLCEALGLDPGWVRMGTQVHGAEVHEARGPSEAGFVQNLRDWPDGDGLVTEVPSLALVVLGADCLPVALWRRDRPRVGAAHAGWRGLVAGVLEATVAALGAPEAIGAAIGPGIGSCCYPVSDEVRERFAERFGESVVVGDAVDLAGAARRALGSAGVADSAIRTIAACTSCDAERFFSHRRDGGRTGRQGAIVWATSS